MYPRVVDVEIQVSSNSDEWRIRVLCPAHKELTPQDILDAIADALINEGELDPYSKPSTRKLDS